MAKFFNDTTTDYPIEVNKEMLQAYDADFCAKLKDHYLKENKAMVLTAEQSLEQLAEFQSLMALADTGSPVLMLSTMQSIAANETYWTQPRKDFYINETNEYITFTSNWRT